jgi:hypothetical protein
MLKLVLQAPPSWSASTIAAALPKVNHPAFVPLLTAAAAADPLKAHHVLPAIHTAAVLGKTAVLEQLLSLRNMQFQETDLVPSLQAAAAGVTPKSVQLLLQAVPKWKQHTLICAMPSSPLPHSRTIRELLNKAPFSCSTAEVTAALITQGVREGRISMVRNLLSATRVRYEEVHLAAALLQAALAGDSLLVPALLSALPNAWSKRTLAQILAQTTSAQAAKHLLQAAPDTWQPEELAPIYKAAAKSNWSEVLHGMLQLQSTVPQESSLRDALCAAAAGGFLRPVQLLLHALPAWSKVTLMLAVSQTRSAGVAQQLLVASPEPWQPAEVSSMAAAAAGQGCCEVLQQVLGVHVVQLQEEHLLPALQAAASNSSIRVLKLLLSVLPTWSKPTICLVLLRAQDVSSVDILLAAAADSWEAKGLFHLAAALAREGRVEVARRVLQVEGFEDKDACLASVLAAEVKGEAAAKVVDVFLDSHPGWQKPSLSKVISAATDAAVVARLLAAAKGWQPEELVNFIEVAARSGAVLKLRELLAVEGVQYQETHLAKALRVAAAAAEQGNCDALQLLLQASPQWHQQELLLLVNHSSNAAAVCHLLSASKEPWQLQDLVSAVARALVKGQVEKLAQLLTGGWVQFQEEHLSPLLPPAAAVSTDKAADLLRVLLAALPCWSKAAVAAAMRGVVRSDVAEMLIKASASPPNGSGSGWRLEDTLSCLDAAVYEGRPASVQALILACKIPGEIDGRLQEALGRGLTHAAAKGDLGMVNVLLCPLECTFHKRDLLAAIAKVPAGAVAVTHELLRPRQWMQHDLGSVIKKVTCDHGEDVAVLEVLLRCPAKQPWDLVMLGKVIAAAAGRGRMGVNQLRTLMMAASSGVPGEQKLFCASRLKAGRFKAWDFQPAIEKAAREGDVAYLGVLLDVPDVVWTFAMLRPACSEAMSYQESTKPLEVLLNVPWVWNRHAIYGLMKEARHKGAEAHYQVLNTYY